MIRAAADFALCTRRPQSCSRHGSCARAQLGSANTQRQRWCAPLLTGEACDLYHAFDTGRLAAANGTTSALAGSDAGPDDRTNAEAGEGTFPGDRTTPGLGLNQ